MNRSRLVASAAIGVALAAIPWFAKNPLLLSLAAPSVVTARFFHLGDEPATWQMVFLSVLNAGAWAGVGRLCYWHMTNFAVVAVRSSDDA